MSMNSTQHKASKKKPSGGRPIARRLFSKDSAIFSSSSGDESSSGGKLTALQEKAEVGETTPWLSSNVVSSPATLRDEGSEQDSPDPSGTTVGNSSSSSVQLQAPIPRPGRRIKPSFDLETPSSPPPVSPSKLRWDHLRRHVTSTSSKISSASNATIASGLPSVTSPTPSFSSFSQINVPTGVPTPKPSRFPRFGFRQVVTEARVVADDLTRRFSEEIHRACWAVRFDEVTKAKATLKNEREWSQGGPLGSALSLPMKSSASLPLSNASSVNLLASVALKRPPSMANLVQPQTIMGRSTALGNLQAVIVRYASVARQKETTYLFLPHEREVLSAILVAFLSQSTGRVADDERRLSMEIFETVVRTWRTPSPDGELERCLWCCKAATMPQSPLRSRLLLNLTFLLSREPILTTPISFRSILPSIALLIPHFLQSDDSGADTHTVKHLISEIVAGNCGHLDLADLEQKYNSIALHSDSEDDLRKGICLDALLRSLEVASSEQQLQLHRLIEDQWKEPDTTVFNTPLRMKIHVGKINTFLRAAARLLHQLSNTDLPSKCSAASASILRVLSFRVVPELDSMGDEVRDSRRLAVKVAMALAGIDSVERFQAAEFIIGWLENSFWRACVEVEMKELATSAEWLTVIRIADVTLDVLPTDTKKMLSGFMIPQFQERLVSEPPPLPCGILSELFETFARVNPQVFYKPLFACAASTKELVIAHHLSLLIAINRVLPDFWTTDAEMVAVAAMSDIGSVKSGQNKEESHVCWGEVRPGQCVVLLELLGALKSARIAQKEINTVLSESQVKLVKFAGALEARLAAWVVAREQTSILPFSHRCLIAALLLEVRLLVKSLKYAQWLRNIVDWTAQYEATSQVTDDAKVEVLETRDIIQLIWVSAKQGLRPHKHRRSTVVLSPRLENAPSGAPPDLFDASFDARLLTLSVLEGPPIRPLLELLVAMSGGLLKEHYVQLIPVLWGNCLDSGDPKTDIHAAFLNMQCAEKASSEYLQVLYDDLRSNENANRRRVVLRISTLASWRFQLLSLTYIADKMHRRPFKLARPPIAFVATDVGSPNYVHVRGMDDGDQHKGPVLPPDLRRHLSEIGWANEDEPTDQLLEWIRTPMSLLASTQLETISKQVDIVSTSPDIVRSGSPSPTSSPGRSPGEGNVVRQNSMSGGHHSIKRRAVFVQTLLPVFAQLAALSLAENFVAGSMAKDLLLDFMRDDPTVLCRALMEDLSDGNDSLDGSIFTLHTFLQFGKTLPPRLTHHVFSHLAGFLKYLAKETDTPDSFRQLAHVIPSLAKYAPQVSDLSVQAVRRAKIEVFLLPSGQLWFPESTPRTSLFPKGPGQNTNPFEDVSTTMMHMLMIRTSQNILFVDLLKRNPQDVHFLRKSWTSLILPDINGYPEEDLSNTIVISRGLSNKYGSFRGGIYRAGSLSFSRSHLSLVAQMLRCLTRHLNDRSELEMVLDGVNRILLRHADDIGIVGQALTVYMIASTRFRRLMAANKGFSLFLPALIKVYCENEGNVAVKESVEYAVHKFFAVHEEAFVYQALDSVSMLVNGVGADNEWLAGCAYSLLSTLKNGPSASGDSAGIRDVNKAQEEETALAITADERPQLFLASLTAEGKPTSEDIEISLSAGIFDNKRFQPDNIVRLLLTVIGHDPTSPRAERFLRLFRFMALHFYNASSSARAVLRDGLVALGILLYTKLSGKTRAMDPSDAKVEVNGREEDSSAQGHSKNHSGTQVATSDPQAMRADYISALAVFFKTGGQIRTEAFRRAVSLAIILLKDAGTAGHASDCVSNFLSKVGEGLASREDLKLSSSLLKEMVPIINLHGASLDLTGFLNCLTNMSSNPVYANDESFSGVVVHQLCPSILDLCEAVADDNLIESLSYHSALVSLLSHAVGLIGSDIIGELENRELTIGFISGIILPVALTLRTTSDLTIETQWTDSRRQDAHARAWVRLASMTTKSLQTLTSSANPKATFTSSPDGLSPPNLGEKPGRKGKMTKEDAERVSVRCIVCLATLKLIIIRGEDDMTAIMPSIWLRLAAMLRPLFEEGSIAFAFHLPSSPTASPLSSPMVENFPNSLSAGRLAHKRMSSQEDKAYSMLRPGRLPSMPPSPTSPAMIRHVSERIRTSEPRAVDYLLWSFMEFVCRRRSPLTLHLRTFMHEKLITVHESLTSFSAGTESTYNARSRRSLRPVSTVFSKPRMSINAGVGSRSVAASPDVSPRLTASDSVTLRGSIPPPLVLDVFASSGPIPPSPGFTPSNSLKKRIVHLGPQIRPQSPSFISPSSTSDSVSTTSKWSHDSKGLMDIRKVVSLTRIRSRGLQLRTYDRVRVVQACLGYRTLLPLPAQTVSSRSNSLDVPGSTEYGTPGFEHISRLGSMPSVSSPRASAEFCAVDSGEPDVAAWTKGQAVEAVLTEVRETVDAWENGLFHVSLGKLEHGQIEETGRTVANSFESGPTSASVSGTPGLVGLGFS